MKFKTLSVLAVAVLAVAGGVSAHTAKQPEASAKPALQRTTYQAGDTYQSCMKDALAQCTALHPSNPIARWECIEDIRARICETLPGAP